MKFNSPRIVFFGTSDFAQAILKDLIEDGFNVVGVVTRPDKPTGRSLKISYSFVKQLVLDLNLSAPLFQPAKVSTTEFENELRDLNPDLFVVAAFGEIIKPHILAIPPLGSINVHPSLLPKYRGPSPLQAALWNGDKETGVCIIDVAEKMDAGVIFSKKTFTIEPQDNFTSLQAKALKETRSLLSSVIKDKSLQLATGEPQDESSVTFCHKIKAEDEKINWGHALFQIHNQIRALSDKPGAWTYLKIGEQTRRVKIYSSRLFWSQNCPHAADAKGVMLVHKDGQVLQIEELQPEGKARMKAAQFLMGLKAPWSFI